MIKLLNKYQSSKQLRELGFTRYYSFRLHGKAVWGKVANGCAEARTIHVIVNPVTYQLFIYTPVGIMDASIDQKHLIQDLLDKGAIEQILQ